MSVEWVDHPPERRRTGKWHKICAELRSHSGHWARVDTGVSSTAYAPMLKQGRLGDAEPGEFEATCRRRPDGLYDVYARHIGIPHKDAEKMGPVGDAKCGIADADDRVLVYSD